MAATAHDLILRLAEAERRAECAEAAALILAPIALPALIEQARARLTRNPPGSDGFDAAASNFAAVLRLRQSIRRLGAPV